MPCPERSAGHDSVTAMAANGKDSIRKLVIGTRLHLHNERTLTARFNKHRLLAGQLLLVLRRRIEAGEAGTVSWWDWYEANFASFRSRKDAEKIMKMAQADRAQQERTEARNVRRREARQEREKQRARECGACIVCQRKLRGQRRKTRRYCSDECRQRAYRQRQVAEGKAGHPF